MPIIAHSWKTEIIVRNVNISTRRGLYNVARRRHEQIVVGRDRKATANLVPRTIWRFLREHRKMWNKTTYLLHRVKKRSRFNAAGHRRRSTDGGSGAQSVCINRTNVLNCDNDTRNIHEKALSLSANAGNTCTAAGSVRHTALGIVTRGFYLIDDDPTARVRVAQRPPLLVLSPKRDRYDGKDPLRMRPYGRWPRDG